jgi:hypothetical protein
VAILGLGVACTAQAGDTAKTAVGTAVGAAAGTAIGDQIGGKTGGIIGGALGGAAGGAATTKGRGSEKAGAIIGGAAGGAGGAAVGYSQGGSTGGIIGAGVGGAVGGAVGKNVADKVPAPPNPLKPPLPGVVVAGDGGKVVERQVRYEDDGDHRGGHGHKGKHKRGKHCDDDHPGRGNAYGKYKDCD